MFTKQNHKIKAELDRNNLWLIPIDGYKNEKSNQSNVKQECKISVPVV